jgi:hypothetical protein
VVDCCERDNEDSCYIKFGGFLGQLSGCRLLKKDLLHGVSDLVGILVMLKDFWHIKTLVHFRWVH